MDKPLCLSSPRLQVPLSVWHKMMAYILNCPTEVNGFGLVDQVFPNLFVLSDVFITEQVASPAHVEVSPATLGTMMTDMIRRGEDPSRIKFQWHSHVNMGAYFSPTDLENIENWAGDWLISVVANKQGEYKCRLDTFKNLRIGIELKPEIIAMIDDHTLDSTAREIAQKVKRATRFTKQPVTSGKPASNGLFSLGDPERDIQTTRRPLR